MQVNLINSYDSYSTTFGARRIGGEFKAGFEKTFRAKNPKKEEKYCKQYISKVRHVCDAAKGDLSEATNTLNRLEHRFFYNTCGLDVKKIKSRGKT